jgi:hypothetical protein
MLLLVKNNGSAIYNCHEVEMKSVELRKIYATISKLYTNSIPQSSYVGT